MTTPAAPFPTLLNKSDAMLYAADRLEEMVRHMMAAKAMASLVAGYERAVRSMDPNLRAEINELKTIVSGIVDANLQETAMREAADEIRAMANEHKLVEARAAKSGVAIG